jgi:predicted small integral membrane protein
MNRSDAAGAIDRVLAVLLAIIPMGIGFLAFLNNISDWSHSVHEVVSPLLTMEAMRESPEFHWRAFAPALAPLCYGLVTTVELTVGIVASVGVGSMLRGFSAPYADFAAGSRIAQRACTLGVIVWLTFFFVIGGDWFLAWKNKNLLFIQSDSLMYAAAATIVLFALRATESRILQRG